MLFLCTVLALHHVTPSGAYPCGVASGMASVVVSEFYPCGLQDDEYLVLENVGGLEVDMCNWSITDLEGTLTFTSHVSLAPGARMAMSCNSSSYLQAFGRLPEAALDSDSCTFICRSGTFRLADAGDSISLRTPAGATADFVMYGLCDEGGSGWTGPPVPALRKGEVARRVTAGGVPQDTDSLGDWTPFREHKYGYTDRAACAAELGAGDVTAFVSPDCGLSEVLASIDHASRVVRVCAYEFSSEAVCSALSEAIYRGVVVKVLVDGAPAGGMADGQVSCLSFLQDYGADVRILLGNLSEDTVQHVGPLHAKYMVVDDSVGVVMSENFVESGLPEDPYDGNRGWGIAFHDERLSGYLISLFEDDSRLSRQDVKRWNDDPRYSPGLCVCGPDRPAIRTGIMQPFTTTAGSGITIVPSPDGSLTEPFLVRVIADSGRLLVEQFQADLMWRDRWTGTESLNPLVAAVEEALSRGSDASVLLDPSWFNAEDNSEVVEHIAAFAGAAGLSGDARLMDCSGPSKTLHNKGLVLDGAVSIVSSNNWGVSSFSRNRELALIVESAEVAGYFESAFRMDWEPDSTQPEVDLEVSAKAAVGETVLLNGSRSSDDRGIAQWIWSFEGEGLLVADGAVARFYPTRPGTFLVRLSVRDAWGNMDSEVVRIEVSPSTGSSNSVARIAPWAAAVPASLGGAALGALAARKINHHNRGSG